MEKKIVEDVAPPRRSIREIALPRHHDRKHEHASVQEHSRDVSTQGTGTPPPVEGLRHPEHKKEHHRNKKTKNDSPREGSVDVLRERPKRTRARRRRFVFGVGFFGFLAFVAFLLLNFMFAGAEVLVTPRVEQITVDGVFEAYREPPSPLDLSYEVMTITKKNSRTVPAKGQEHAEVQAKGNITIYNNHSDEPQRLIKNTRFETPNGLIFRIPNSVDVPGRRTENGKTIPGSVEVAVFADAVGAEYNIDPTRFTIPGLKGDPRYDTFYAESFAPMTGGFVGTRKTVDESVAHTVREEIRNELAGELARQAHIEKPSEFVLYESAIRTSSKELPSEPDGDAVILSEEVTLSAVMFDAAELARFIARRTIPDFDNGTVVFTDPSELRFSFATTETEEENDPMNLQTGDHISFSLVGKTHVVWTFNEDRLRYDLAGKSKSQDVFANVLSGYPSIANGKAFVRPFWHGAFPEDPERISIVKEKTGE